MKWINPVLSFAALNFALVTQDWFAAGLAFNACLAWTIHATTTTTT